MFSQKRKYKGTTFFLLLQKNVSFVLSKWEALCNEHVYHLIRPAYNALMPIQ